mmetsp:Transcript_5237/g.12241  ORF Transcript_5237/g.12241 Transcript_5237/m.12241 type:complete len:674 (-) Transcript_5237:233-2254(-)
MHILYFHFVAFLSFFLSFFRSFFFFFLPRQVDERTFVRWVSALRRTRAQNTVLWILAPSLPGRDRLVRRAAQVLLQGDLQGDLREGGLQGGDRTAQAKAGAGGAAEKADFPQVEWTVAYEEASRRLVFADLAPRDEHLWRLRAADLALDTPLYNSHTLGADYLWAGVPMVTALWGGPNPSSALDPAASGPPRPDDDVSPCSGAAAGELPATAKFASRVGASLVGACGLASSLVATGWGREFEDLIVRLAEHDDERRRLERRLERGREPGSLSPLWDTARWVAALEAGIDQAWRMRPRAFDTLHQKHARADGKAEQGGANEEDRRVPAVHITVPTPPSPATSEAGAAAAAAAEVSVIVLDRKPERRAHAEARILGPLRKCVSRGEIKAARAVSACDALSDPRAAQARGLELGLELAEFWEAMATAGQVGCTVSHATEWQNAAKREGPTIILEDDALVDSPVFGAVVPRLLAELEDSDAATQGPEWDLCYLYVYPDHWPADGPEPLEARAVAEGLSERLLEGGGGGGGGEAAGGGLNEGEGGGGGGERANAAVGSPLTRGGFHTYCLLAYAVSPRGARKLCRLVAEEEVYAPVDNMVSDWRKRGLLQVRCPTASGLVENAGQLDLRAFDDPEVGRAAHGEARMPSNIWGSPGWAEVLAEADPKPKPSPSRGSAAG